MTPDGDFELCQHWFRELLVACSAPSHYLNQYWLILNWALRKKLHWNSNRNSNISIQENVFENDVCKMAAILFQPQYVNLSKFRCSWMVNSLCPAVAGSKVSITSNLTHWGRDKMAAIFQTTFSKGFSWMKMYQFRLTFHWSLFLGVQLTIFQHWFR